MVVLNYQFISLERISITPSTVQVLIPYATYIIILVVDEILRIVHHVYLKGFGFLWFHHHAINGNIKMFIFGVLPLLVYPPIYKRTSFWCLPHRIFRPICPWSRWHWPVPGWMDSGTYKKYKNGYIGLIRLNFDNNMKNELCIRKLFTRKVGLKLLYYTLRDMDIPCLTIKHFRLNQIADLLMGNLFHITVYLLQNYAVRCLSTYTFSSNTSKGAVEIFKIFEFSWIKFGLFYNYIIGYHWGNCTLFRKLAFSSSFPLLVHLPFPLPPSYTHP